MKNTCEKDPRSIQSQSDAQNLTMSQARVQHRNVVAEQHLPAPPPEQPSFASVRPEPTSNLHRLRLLGSKARNGRREPVGSHAQAGKPLPTPNVVEGPLQHWPGWRPEKVLFVPPRLREPFRIWFFPATGRYSSEKQIYGER